MTFSQHTDSVEFHERTMKIVRTVSLAILLLGVSSCSAKYQSRMEAAKACDAWLNSIPLVEREGGIGRQNIYDNRIGAISYEKYMTKNRNCRLESETRQYLGMEDFSTGRVPYNEFERPWELVKRFRY